MTSLGGKGNCYSYLARPVNASFSSPEAECPDVSFHQTWDKGVVFLDYPNYAPSSFLPISGIALLSK